jgi:hypothetical protein
MDDKELIEHLKRRVDHWYDEAKIYKLFTNALVLFVIVLCVALSVVLSAVAP